MANDFSGDANCKALWKLESGALTTDSKSTNTLTNTGPVVNDTGDYKEGNASAVMASGHRLTIVDANLCAGFPFKNGDTTRLATFCFWHKQIGTTSWKCLLTKGDYAAGAFWFGLPWAAMAPTFYVSNVIKLALAANVVDGNWTHYALTIDAPNKLVSITIYDATTGLTNSISDSINVDIPAAATIFSLGNDSGGSAGNNGKMDEVVVFNRILFPTEINAIRNGTYPPSPFVEIDAAGVQVVYDLVGQLQIDGAGIQVVYDSTVPCDKCTSLTTVGALTVPIVLDMSPCSSLTTVGTCPIVPLDHCRSLTTVGALTTPIMASCRSLTLVGECPVIPLDHCRSLTTVGVCPDVPPDSVRSITKTESIAAPMEGVLSFTTCGIIPENRMLPCESVTITQPLLLAVLHACVSKTVVHPIPPYNDGLFLIF